VRIVTAMSPVRAPERPNVVLVAHDVHDGGGMERACAELVRHALHDVDFTIVSRTLAADLRGVVEWRRVWTPSRPFLLKYASFAVLAGLRLCTLRGAIRHSVGAIVPNRVDVAAVHFCHAGFVSATGRLAPGGTPIARRLNTAATRVASLLAERWCYRPSRLRAFAAVSAGVADELRRFYPRVPINVTPNGVDASRFGGSVQAMPARSSASVVALFVGGDWDRKGLAVAIEGTAAAVRLGAQLELWVVGHGDERRFRRLADDAGVGQRVRFFGFRRDTEAFYAAADIFVLPTAYEAHPLVPHEAAAAGLPVVITRVNGVHELVGNDEAGILVERRPDSVGAALARLALDDELRRRQASAARARTRELTWARSSASVVSLYRELAP
jgi:glycosyltransferase involved in cell wall biosynthesis